MQYRFLLALCFIAISATLFAQSPLLAPQEENTAYQHLWEVNKEWASQANQIELSEEQLSFQTDIERIQFHLRLVENNLRNRSTKHLSLEQRQKRMALLDVLNDYWQAAQFPINLYHDQRQPYFVDHKNTACAVGHLMRESGQEALVARIQKEDNYAYVAELAKYEELLDWADDNGFTTEELAWIQPSYNPMSHKGRVFGNNLGVNGTIHTIKENSGTLVFAGDFSAVDGHEATAIIAYDGNDWIDFPGIDGEIFEVLPGYPLIDRMHVIGNFSLYGSSETVNVAAWDNGTWKALQTGDMDGDIHTVFRHGAEIYIGGDFQKVNGETRPYLAAYNLNAEAWVDFEGSLSVDGPVYSGMIANGQILLGGDFSNVGPEATAVTNVAYFEPYSQVWTGLPANEMGPIKHLLFEDGIIYVAGSLEDDHPFATLSGGLWLYHDYFQALGDGEFHGFVRKNGETPLLYGGYTTSGGGVSYFSYGLSYLNSFGIGTGLAISDGSVRAAVYWNDQLLVAGDFTTIGGTSVNDLAFVDLISSTIDPIDDDQLAEVYQYNGELFIRNLASTNGAQIAIYDMSGRQIQANPLTDLIGTQTLSLNKLPAGVYAYQLAADGRRMSGQFVLVR